MLQNMMQMKLAAAESHGDAQDMQLHTTNQRRQGVAMANQGWIKSGPLAALWLAAADGKQPRLNTPHIYSSGRRG